MKKIIISTLIALGLGFIANAQSKTPFPYPMAPDTISTLQGRTSYIMLRFWDNADMKKLMNDTASFNTAFADYLSFMPYSSADSVKKSIQQLTGMFKNDPKSTMKIVKAAEKNLYGPEAPFWADEQYLLFVRAALTNKKVSKKDKEYYLGHIKLLNASQVGSTIAPLSYTTNHGAEHNLYDHTGEYTLIYIHQPGCSDCNLTLLRMETDVALNELAKSGRLKIIDLYTGEPDEAWKKSVDDRPFGWETGTASDLGSMIDIRNLPAMYLIDKDRKIISRDLNINQLLSIAAALHQQPK